jgi:hypothetical protein
MKNNKNKSKIAITEEMIPIVVGNEEVRMIRVKVDDHLASLFLHDRVWNTMKVVILFDEPHPKWDECFTTKYFRFERPGTLDWGHNEEYMNIDAVLEV